jgi:hypothetical protein
LLGSSDSGTTQQTPLRCNCQKVGSTSILLVQPLFQQSHHSTASFYFWFCFPPFLLVCINCTKGFHCDTSIHAYTVLWSNSSPLLVLLVPPLSLPFKTI